MKGRAGFPPDLAVLVLWPLLLVAFVMLFSGAAMTCFNWLHQPSRPVAQHERTGP